MLASFSWALVAAIAMLVITMQAEASPIVLRSHVISYAAMSPAQFLSSAVSQQFTDLSDRSVLTAISLDIPALTNVSVHALMFEFAVGRRAIGSHNAFNFAWDVLKQLPAPVVVETQIYSNCADAAKGCVSCPCTLLRTIRMDTVSNVSSFYLQSVTPFGNVYHVDVLLRNRAGEFVVAAPSATKNERIWFVYVAHMPLLNGTTGYEYTHRLPVASSPTSQPALMVQDIDHILGGNWVSWKDGNSIAATYFANVSNPLPGFMIAGEVTPYSVPRSPSPSPARPLSPPPPPPSPSPSPTYVPNSVGKSPTPSVKTPTPTPTPTPLLGTPLVIPSPREASSIVQSPSSEASWPAPSPTTDTMAETPSSGLSTRLLILYIATPIGILLVLLCLCALVVVVCVMRKRRLARMKREARANDTVIPYSSLRLGEGDMEVPTDLDSPHSSAAITSNQWRNSDEPQPGALVSFGRSAIGKASIWFANLFPASSASNDNEISLRAIDLDGSETGDEQGADFDSFGEPIDSDLSQANVRLPRRKDGIKDD